MEVCGRDEGSERGEKEGVLIKGMEMGGFGTVSLGRGLAVFYVWGEGVGISTIMGSSRLKNPFEKGPEE